MLIFCYPDEHAPTGLALPAGCSVLTDRDLDWCPSLQGPPVSDLAAVERAVRKLKGVLVPLSEEAVLPVLAHTAQAPTALVCSHRIYLRQRLDSRAPHLNPVYWTNRRPDRAGLHWVKVAASTLSRGVAQIDFPADKPEHVLPELRISAREELLRLARYTYPNDYLVEEHVPGPQFEITGVVEKPGAVRWFIPLQQHWAGNVIAEYEPELDLIDELENVGNQVVKALEIRQSFVCIEMKMARNKVWKVIEAHCRLGDDRPEKGYPAAEYMQLGAEFLSRRLNK